MIQPNHRTLVCAVFGLVTTALAPSPVRPDPLPRAVSAAADSISAPRIAADVAFLADDALEGRATGTRGYQLAAAYVGRRFAALGLVPGGDSAWYQHVPFRRAELDEAASTLAVVRDGQASRLRFGVDALVAPDLFREDIGADAALVFAGYGVSAPELGYDDFATADVAGKVVVEFSGAPPRFPNDPRAYYGNRSEKERQAAAHGAVGMLLITRPADRARTSWPALVRQWGFPMLRWTDDAGAPANSQAALRLVGRLSDSTAAGLFAGAAKTFAQAAGDADSSVAGGFALPASVRARVVSRHAATASANVVAYLRGSDPRLASEAIVLTAHLDHLGITAPVAGDSINNGAYDNGSGTAILLEVARAFGRMTPRPRRSILFVAVTGEEEGLQGSDYFARHAAPAGMRVVADVNLDEILLLRPMTHVIAIGAEHSTLAQVVQQAAPLAGLEVMPNPSPELVQFARSDQFSFVKRGVPSVFPHSGADGTREGLDEIKKWIATCYHQPCDDMNQHFDWDSAARFGRFVFDTTWLIAESPAPPGWNPGDFFGNTFAGTR